MPIDFAKHNECYGTDQPRTSRRCFLPLGSCVSVTQKPTIICTKMRDKLGCQPERSTGNQAIHIVPKKKLRVSWEIAICLDLLLLYLCRQRPLSY